MHTKVKAKIEKEKKKVFSAYDSEFTFRLLGSLSSTA